MAADGLPTPENPGRLASAAAIANPFQAALSAATAARKAAGKRAPKLVGILATPSPPSVAYAEWTKKACEAVGIEFEIWRTWDEAAQDEPMDGQTPKPEGKSDAAAEPAAAEKPDMELEGDVEDLIIAANASDDVHGIMVYYPIFGGRQDTYLQQIVDPRKDVEGLHFSYCWNMYHNVRWILPSQLGGAPGTTSEPQAVNASPSEPRRQSVSGGTDEVVPAGFAKSILPCTPLAVVKCLEALGVYDHSLPYGDRLYGKTITIVNRSEVVGRPLAALLSNDGAKVYSVDLGSVQEFNKRAPDDGQADDVHSANGRTRSSVVLAARKANSSRRLRPHHVVRPCSMDLQGCVGASNVIISGVPSANFKIPTDWVPRGATTVNFSSEKNFEKDVRTRAACHLPAIGKTTIAMLQRNLLRLVDYREQGDAQGFGAPSQRGDGPDGPRGPGGPGGPSGGAPRPGQGDAPGPNGSDPRGGQPPPSHDGGSNGPDTGSAAGGQAPTGSRQAAAFLAPSSQPSWKTSSETSLGRSLSSRADDMQIDPPFQTALARGRASTLSIPRPTASRERFSASTLHSPTYPVSQMGSSFGSSSAATTSSSLWDWRRSRRDSVASGTTTYSSLDCPSPTTGPSHCSPLLFAPVGASRQAPSVAHSSRSVSSHHYMSSPGTPMSPLFMDGLSVEDAPGVSSTAHADAREHGPSVLERPVISRREVAGRTYRSSTFSSPDSHPLLLERSPYQTLSGLAPPAASESASARQAQEAADQTQSDPAAAAPVGDRFASSRRRRRPPYSYSSLIAQAIASSPEGRMTLREIYTWISTSLPHLYSMEGPEHQGWQNTVRHNLSLNKSFVKVARTAQDIYESCASGNPSLSQAARGKGGWWTLDVPVAQALLGPNYKGEEDGDSGNEDTAATTGPGGRPPRRRRTSSFAPVAGSIDAAEEARPKTGDGPSVLARVPDSPPAASRTAGPASAAGVPSVLQRPRTQSMEVQDVAEHLALMQHQQQQQLQLQQQQQAAARPLTAHSSMRSSLPGAPLAAMSAAQHVGRARGMTTSVVDEQRAGLPRHLRLNHAAAPSHAAPMPSVPPHSPLYGHFAAQQQAGSMQLASPSKRKHVLERDDMERYERSPLASRSDLPADEEMQPQQLSSKHSVLQQPRSAAREETPLASREPVRSSGMSIRDLLNS